MLAVFVFMSSFARWLFISILTFKALECQQIHVSPALQDWKPSPGAQTLQNCLLCTKSYYKTANLLGSVSKWRINMRMFNSCLDVQHLDFGVPNFEAKPFVLCVSSSFSCHFVDCSSTSGCCRTLDPFFYMSDGMYKMSGWVSLEVNTIF